MSSFRQGFCELPWKRLNEKDFGNCVAANAVISSLFGAVRLNPLVAGGIGGALGSVSSCVLTQFSATSGWDAVGKGCNLALSLSLISVAAYAAGEFVSSHPVLHI